MAIFDVINSAINAIIYPNGVQAITGGLHNTISKAMVAAAGASQLDGPVDEDTSPGTPDHYKAYLLFPGTYPNFSATVVTTPLALVKWNGSAWIKTDIKLPTAYEYRKCRTNEVLEAGLGYTSEIEVDMTGGGWIAKAGQWVQLVNRQTGDYDFVQLAADIDDETETMEIVPYILQKNFHKHSIVEIDSMVNMKWYGIELFGSGVNTYVTLPSNWRTPPLAAVDPNVWYDLMIVVKSGQTCRWNPTPEGPFEFNIVNDGTRLKVNFAETLSIYDSIIVRLYQPRLLIITA